MNRFSSILIATMFTMFVHDLFGQSVKHGKADFMIHYDLLSLLGDQISTSMGVSLGVEWGTGSGKSVQASLLYIFHCASCGKPYTTIETASTRGFRVSAGYRFYLFTAKGPLSGFHTGPAVEFQYTAYEMDETYDNGIPNTYRVYRNLMAAHAMAGYQLRVAGPLFLDPEIGLGFRYISSRNEDRKSPGSGQHEFPYDKDFESGHKWFPSIQLSIKLGIKL